MDKELPHDSAQPRKVAIIAVHGVGDPGPGSTAQSITSLLVRLTQASGAAAYSSFTQTALTIETHAVNPGQGKSGMTGRLKQNFLAKRLNSTPREKVSHDPIAFIRSQLQDFVLAGDDRTYQTVRHAGERQVPGGSCPVEVYEVYWADLMRLGSGVVSFFTEIYQLMFHLGHLATKTVSAYVDDPRYSGSNSRLGGVYVGAVTFASQYLSTFVFLFNVALLPVALLTTWLVGSVSVWLWTLLCLMPGLIGLLTLKGFNKSKNLTFFQLGLVAIVLAGSALIVFRHDLRHGVETWFVQVPHIHALLSIFPITLFLLLSTVVIGGFVIRYDQVIPNSRAPAALLGLFFWGTFVTYLARDWYNATYHPEAYNGGPYGGVTQAVLEWLMGLIVFGYLNYLALLSSEIVAVVVGAVVLLRSTSADRQRGATRVWGTVMFGLGLPTVMFSLVTITVWAAYTKIVMPHITNAAFASYFGDSLLSYDSQGFILTVVGAGIALVTVVAVLIPSICAEFCAFPRPSQPDATRLARWLNGGGGTLRVALAILLAAAIAPFGLAAYTLFSGQSLLEFHNPFSALVILSFTGFFGLTVLAVKDDLAKWTLALGPILNKILDVDSYFRQFPRNATPKARVFCRYVSLLRHVMKQHDVDKIVILSHSQGTVITADLLRFLHDPTVPHDPDLFVESTLHREFKKKVYLFTMGCPLRQLYSERFPTWYDWARSATTGPAAPVNTTPPIEQQLGVEIWSNAYGAGDYIGRALWRSVNDPKYADVPAVSWAVNQPPLPIPPADVVTEKPSGHAREFCIGPFAHIQYWNEPGDSVARELDRLIS